MGNADCISNDSEIGDILGTNSDVDHFAFVDPGQSGFRFQECMFLKWRFECVFDDEIGFFKAGRYVAFADPALGNDVALTLDDGRFGFIASIGS